MNRRCCYIKILRGVFSAFLVFASTGCVSVSKFNKLNGQIKSAEKSLKKYELKRDILLEENKKLIDSLAKIKK